MADTRVSFAPWQQSVLDNALAALAEGRLAHALLLVGPANMGKGAVAEILAQRLLCSSPAADGLACGKCRSCLLYAAKTHGDIQRVSFELNEKGDKLRTEISVDQIRRLGQWFSLTPQLGGAQVALIEPADGMNVAASNALLKTLEEPSANRFLLIVTSRPGRLPATIRSRCQRLEFRIPARGEAQAWLRGLGHADAQIEVALDAARGQPGLAAEWLGNGGLQLRRDVVADLNAVGSGRMSPIEQAQRWLADDRGELRLRFAADLALSAASRQVGASAKEPGGLTMPTDFPKLSAWFDAINRTREQLRAPIRNDLVLAGLLREWRTMFQ
ncbi:MAG TPA: DNA polymerase III subunit delta' [Arenimonas sp.]|uniref:DNA polymerase III subunit delta' n=1 Tax=Arenimonas sp. TaxID=1872635 RepID=UPI002CA3F602|nr:DNA polymerase III subunit delta' [Arenimonas sp.]HMB55765.1 DNA polymerase III subunit delta' [Arenimonas sp.]